MRGFTNIVVSVLVTLGLASVLAVASPQPASAAGCSDRLLTFPTWYRGVSKTVGKTCEIVPPSQAEGALSKFIWKIILNIIEMLVQLVGYTALVFLIIGGFRYITATGEPDKMTAAKKTITNAIVGLIIALASVAIVNAVAGAI